MMINARTPPPMYIALPSFRSMDAGKDGMYPDSAPLTPSRCLQRRAGAPLAREASPRRAGQCNQSTDKRRGRSIPPSRGVSLGRRPASPAGSPGRPAGRCGREDSNLQGPCDPTGPKPAASTSSATPALIKDRARLVGASATRAVPRRPRARCRRRSARGATAARTGSRRAANRGWHPFVLSA
jgi:hypothetical protein